MSETLTDYHAQKEGRLRDFIAGIHQLNDPKEMHYMYMSYEHWEEEEPLYEFWRDTVHDLIEKVFKRTYASPDEIYNWFVIKGKKPLGLMEIIQEMNLRKEFISKEELLDERYYSEASWLSAKFNQVMSIFSSPKPQQLDTSKELVSLVGLEKCCDQLVDWAFVQDKQVFSMNEIQSLLKKYGKNKDDIKIILTHLQRTDRMKVDGWVKIGEKGKVPDITEAEKTTFKLTNVSQELEEKVDKIKDKIAELRDKAKLALKDKNKEKATTLLREKKNFEKTESILVGQKMKIDKQLMDIDMSASTKETLAALKFTTQQQKLIDEDLEDAEEIIEAISEQNYNLQKINEMFTSDTDVEEDDEALLKELEDQGDGGLLDYDIGDNKKLIKDKHKAYDYNHNGEDEYADKEYEEEKELFA